MKRRIIGPVGVALFSAFLSLSMSSRVPAEESASEGMVVYASDTSFEETLERVEGAVQARGLFLMRVLDHSASAAKMGQELAPNSVVLFGNPRIGSQLMNCEPRVGIDLPNKLLIWESGGVVKVAFNSPAYLVGRHHIEGCSELLERVHENLDAVARTVAGRHLGP